MNRTPPSAERQRLIAAAATLARQGPAVTLTEKKVCAAARCPPAAFRRHFKRRTDYVLAVQQAFMDAVRDRIVESMAAQAEGYDRVRQASETYLDACLEHQPLRLWLLAARKGRPELADALRRQNDVYQLLLAGEFKKLGWGHPKAAARLYLAMLMETGLMETLTGTALPELRATLRDFLRAYS